MQIDISQAKLYISTQFAWANWDFGAGYLPKYFHHGASCEAFREWVDKHPFLMPRDPDNDDADDDEIALISREGMKRFLLAVGLAVRDTLVAAGIEPNADWQADVRPRGIPPHLMDSLTSVADIENVYEPACNTLVDTIAETKGREREGGAGYVYGSPLHGDDDRTNLCMYNIDPRISSHKLGEVPPMLREKLPVKRKMGAEPQLGEYFIRLHDDECLTSTQSFEGWKVNRRG